MPASQVQVRVTARLATGSRVEMFVRSAAEQDRLATAKWSKISMEKSALAASDRAAQYRLVMHADNGDRYPTIERVEIEFQ